MAEEKKESSEKKDYAKEITEKMRKNPWMVATIVLGIFVLVLLYFTLKGGAVVSKETAGKNLAAFATSKGVVLEVVSVSDKGMYYEVEATVNGQQGTFPITKDGKYLIPGDLIPLTAESTPTTPTTPETIPKNTKPVVELYVMSFCPYGVRAENNILPVVNLLGSSIDFKVRYIVNAGTTIAETSSLHGLVEGKQDAVQLAINKYYPAKFLAYLAAFNANCYPLGYSDEAKLTTCWKAEAVKLGIDSAKIETSAYGSEGVALLAAEEAASNAAGASGSPTLVINGVQSSSIYSGTQATQAAICGAFTTAPSACSTVVTSNSTAPATTGSCG